MRSNRLSSSRGASFWKKTIPSSSGPPMSEDVAHSLNGFDPRVSFESMTPQIPHIRSRPYGVLHSSSLTAPPLLPTPHKNSGFQEGRSQGKAFDHRLSKSPPGPGTANSRFRRGRIAPWLRTIPAFPFLNHLCRVPNCLGTTDAQASPQHIILPLI